MKVIATRTCVQVFSKKWAKIMLAHALHFLLTMKNYVVVLLDLSFKFIMLRHQQQYLQLQIIHLHSTSRKNCENEVFFAFLLNFCRKTIKVVDFETFDEPIDKLVKHKGQEPTSIRDPCSQCSVLQAEFNHLVQLRIWALKEIGRTPVAFVHDLSVDLKMDLPLESCS